MKKLFAIAILGILALTSCAQDKKEREEFKEDHSVEQKRNAGVDSAAFEAESPKADSITVK